MENFLASVISSNPIRVDEGMRIYIYGKESYCTELSLE